MRLGRRQFDRKSSPLCLETRDDRLEAGLIRRQHLRHELVAQHLDIVVNLPEVLGHQYAFGLEPVEQDAAE